MFIIVISLASILWEKDTFCLLQTCSALVEVCTLLVPFVIHHLLWPCAQEFIRSRSNRLLKTSRDLMTLTWKLSWFQRFINVVAVFTNPLFFCICVLQSGQFSEDMIPTVGFNMRKVTKGNVTIKVCRRAQDAFTYWQKSISRCIKASPGLYILHSGAVMEQ